MIIRSSSMPSTYRSPLSLHVAPQTFAPKAASAALTGTQTLAVSTETLSGSGATLTGTQTLASVVNAATTTGLMIGSNTLAGGAPLVAQPSQGGVTDSFNRPDNATSLGVADTGQTWNVLTAGAVFGISSGGAYLANKTATLNIAVVESFLSDCTVSATFRNVNSGSGFCWRVQDDANYFFMNATGNGVWRVTGGVFTQLLGTSVSVGASSTVAVVISGSSHKIYVDGTLAGSLTDSSFQTATKHGLWGYNQPQVGVIDSFSVNSPATLTNQPTPFYKGPSPYKYYFVVYDTLTGNALGTFQAYTQMTLTLGLNGTDSLDLTIQTTDPNATLNMCSTLNREIGVFRSTGNGYANAKPLFVGPITKVTPSFRNRTIQMTCNSVWWYMQTRSNELTYDFSHGEAGTELGTIAWQVISDALGKVPGGNIRLSKSPNYPASTGYLVTPIENPYYLYSSDTIGTYVEKLGEGYPAGFDFMIEYARDSTQGINRYFNIFNPFKGQTVDQTMTTLNGVTEFTYDEIATDIIARVTELGTIPANSTTPVILRANSTALAAGLIPMVEQIITRTDTNDLYPTLGDTINGAYGGPNVTLNPRGKWSPSTVYSAYDSVTYNHYQYWAKTANSFATPAANSTHWGRLPSPLGIQALGDLFLHSWPARTYTVTTQPNAALPFGFCTPGDIVTLNLKIDNFVLNAQKRCITQIIRLDSNGETVDYTFNEKPGPK